MIAIEAQKLPSVSEIIKLTLIAYNSRELTRRHKQPVKSKEPAPRRCGFCHFKGHEESECRRKLQAEQPPAKVQPIISQQSKKPVAKCEFCGTIGHAAPNCFRKFPALRNTEKQYKTVSAIITGNNAQEKRLKNLEANNDYLENLPELHGLVAFSKVEDHDQSQETSLIRVPILIEEHKILGILDCGAQTSVIAEHALRQFFKGPLRPLSIRLNFPQKGINARILLRRDF